MKSTECISFRESAFRAEAHKNIVLSQHQKACLLIELFE